VRIPDHVSLLAPQVRFAPGFVRRLAELSARLSAASSREEGAGRSVLAGAGDEFVGHRPYRPGEELRHVDWALLARLDRPFVRVHRREAGERWWILLDASASMGLGEPGKLQRAAEVASGLAVVGLRSGARVRLVASDGGFPSFELRRRSELRGWLAFLEGRRAAGEPGLRALVDHARARIERGTGRVFLIGDLLDLEPREALSLARPGRELVAVQILAPHELAPPEGDVEWLDPEGGARVTVALDERSRVAYAQLLEARLEAWRSSFARHRAAYGSWSSAVPFEEIVRGALARA
jgi:uncharacterized protein (DUF58 family)